MPSQRRSGSVSANTLRRRGKAGQADRLGDRPALHASVVTATRLRRVPGRTPPDGCADSANRRLGPGWSARRPAAGPDLFWNFVLDPKLPATRYVRAIEIQPGNARLVHHANLLVDRFGSLR